MDISTFINTVRKMRQHQRDYFTKGRKQSDLIESKRLEKLVDEALAQGITMVATLEERPTNAEPGQPGLFE